jgi:hypothetical protein
VGDGVGVRPGGVVGGGSRKMRTLPLRGLPGRHVPPGARREEQSGVGFNISDDMTS